MQYPGRSCLSMAPILCLISRTMLRKSRPAVGGDRNPPRLVFSSDLDGAFPRSNFVHVVDIRRSVDF
jgi:hypothetical protein